MAGEKEILQAKRRLASENEVLPADFGAPERRLGTARTAICLPVAVFIIAEQRKPDRAEMRTNLMRASRNERNLKKAYAVF